MKSRVYSVFKNGFESIWHEFNLIGPEKQDIVGQAFFDFFMPYQTDYGEEFIVFVSPVTLDEIPINPGHVIIQYWATKDALPKFNKSKVVEKLFLDIEDIWEYIDPNEVKFERIWPYRKIRNTAWT